MDWIAVTDAQPTENGKYLICHRDKSMEVGSYDDGTWFADIAIPNARTNPAHWMPLPPPPDASTPVTYYVVPAPETSFRLRFGDEDIPLTILPSQDLSRPPLD